jgi:hypothetical protein
MNFHKLFGAFWLIFMRRLGRLWSQFHRILLPFGLQMQCQRI